MFDFYDKIYQIKHHLLINHIQYDSYIEYLFQMTIDQTLEEDASIYKYISLGNLGYYKSNRILYLSNESCKIYTSN